MTLELPLDTHRPDEHVLIVAPTGQDASLASEVLRVAGIATEIHQNLQALVARLNQPAGAIFLAEEALNPEGVSALKTILMAQEPWSDLPILVMVSSQGRGPSGQKVLDLFGPAANIFLLERPFHTATLISSLRVLMRARRRQYEVRHLLSELTNALQQRDEFVSMASHELKNPVTSLKLQNQLNKRTLSRGEDLSLAAETMAKSVERADRQLDRLSALIDDLLDVSRIRAGKLSLEKKETDLSLLTSQVVDQSTPQLAAAKCMIRFEGTPGAVGQWDPARIEQVIVNLLSNAMKYGAGRPIEVTVTRHDLQAVLRVRDHGMGISQENQERIFQRFERAVTGNKIQGLGLGLYIVRQIIEQHGGTITVESALGEGSAFCVALPLK